jgi:RNA polymerase sigma factor (sigma-70 family)
VNDESVPDEDLLLAARTDAHAFTTFYRRHARTVLGYLVRRTGDPELGADLTAETFACALEGVRRFDASRGPAVGWLFGIARHQLSRSLERGRAERRAQKRLGIPRIALDDAALERVESVAESEAAAAGLAVALDALTLRQRHALEARVVDGEDYGAIAVASGVSEATIRKRVSRALHTLRDAMGGQR